MTRQERGKKIMEILDELYPETHIPLHHRDPYTLLVAVLLSAQCTDERVNQVTPELFKLADNPLEMSQYDAEEIQEIIRPCGLSKNKSKAVKKLSEMLIENHGGVVPQSFEELEKLPGVGHKTASVVMAQAFGIPAFPVDTHIHRLAWRWKFSTGKNVEKTEKDLKATFPKNRWNDLHLKIIYFGREYCPARGHNPYECPICSKFGRKPLFADFDKTRAAKK